jgi:hypothetical protein
MTIQQLNPILFFLAVAFTTGCASAAEITPTLELPTLEAPTRQDQPPTPAATPTPGSRSSGAVISFDRSGGIAGISEQWTIYIDGRVIGPAEEEARIPADEVSQLLAEIEAAGFFEWPPRPRSFQTCADCFTYSITVEYQGKANQITLVDGESGAPEEAWTILERILGVLASVSE